MRCIFSGCLSLKDENIIAQDYKIFDQFFQDKNSDNQIRNNQNFNFFDY